MTRSLSIRITALLLVILAITIILTGLLASRRFEDGLAGLSADRYQVVVEDLAAVIAMNLGLGVPIRDLVWASEGFARQMAADPDIHFIDLLDGRGLVAFSSDSGSIGHPAPASWPVGDAATRPWRWQDAATTVVGLPLMSGFGTVEGVLVLGYSKAPLAARLAAMRSRLTLVGIGVLGAFAVVLTAAAALLLRGAKREMAVAAAAIVASEPPAALPAAVAGAVATLRDASVLMDAIDAEIERLDAEDR